MRQLTMPVTSVRGQLTALVTLLFAGVVFFGSWFLLNQAESAWLNDLRASDQAELQELADHISRVDAIATGDPGTPVIPLPAGLEGTAFVLTDQSGGLVAATPIGNYPNPGNEAATPSLTSTLAISAANLFAEADDFESQSLSIQLDGNSATLVAYSSLGPVQAGVDALRSTLWIVGPLLVAVVAALAWFVTGRAFRPVAAITDQVDRIRDERLEERVPVPKSRDEVAHLAKTMNSMLDRLSTSRRRQKEFISDASHELRNPVAASRARLEVALANQEQTDWVETANVVLQEQDRLGDLVDDLLFLARLDEASAQPKREEVDLDDIVFAEASRPHTNPLNLEEVQPVRVLGDHDQLACLLRNLVDNACRYAEHEVKISLFSEAGDAVLLVDDDGPGIPVEDRARVIERFYRSDDGRSRAKGGSGLGLAIVDGIARSHGGAILITEATSGGARVTIRLPLAGDHETEGISTSRHLHSVGG